jgi:hypothetical protein
MIWYKDLQTVRHDWIHLQCEHVLGKGQAKCNTDNDSNTCQSKKVSLVDWKGLAINFT